MFIHYETLAYGGKSVVAVNVQRGTNRPYYLAKKGLRPEGVYVRQGYSSVPATDTAIRQMIKETDGDSFENMRSINQVLTFETTKEEFKKRNIAFGRPQMQTLKLISSDVHYYENKNGYQWTGPDGFNFESAVSTASESEAQTIEHLKTRRQPLTASMT